MPIDPKQVLWNTAPRSVVDPFAAALQAEGVSGPVADLARSIYTQESGAGKNTKTSNRGAVGGMQILPGTFASVADKDWDINDPTQNARAGIRYLKQGYEAAGGDPALAGAFYYGGPGGLEKARRGVAVSDPRNPNAPNTLQYGQQVAARLPKERGLIQRGVEAVIPSANAAELGTRIDSRQIKWDEPAEAQRTTSSINPNAVIWEPEPEGRGAAFGVYPNARRQPGNNTPNASDAIVMGLARGVKDPIDTGAALLATGYDKLTGGGPSVSGLVTGQQGEGARVRAMNDQGKADFKDGYGDSGLASAGRVVGNVAATLPVGPALGAAAKGLGLSRFGTALASGGGTTGAVVAPGLLPAAGNMGIRMAGGAVTGAATAGLIDPSATSLGAGIGAFLPPATRLVGAGSNSLGSLFRPFTASGQERIVGNALREFSTNPTAARNALANATEAVPGSAPIAATAAGDDGIAALSRTMQNTSPTYAANLSARQVAQNQARTAALEDVAGNTGKLRIAEDARDALTAPMRERALQAAGNVPTAGIIGSLDELIANPNNAGNLAQQALRQFRKQIEGLTSDGAINARALYEVRKDIGQLMQGKLQGEVGNLRYAKGQLNAVQEIIDEAIDHAARRGAAPIASASRAVAAPGSQVGVQGGRNAASETVEAGVPNWRGYLQSYSKESIPIKQMETLEEIMKALQTGTVDSQGAMILSAPKLNGILKNQGSDLVRELSPKQMSVLRGIQADLNAAQIANNTGRTVGSNTVQNLGQGQLLESILGRRLGGSTGATATLGRALQIPYGTANKQIQERLGAALLDPKEAARLMTEPQGNSLLRAFQNSSLPYRAVPAISAR